VEHEQAVLQHLLQNHLYVKAETCQFHAHKISFLGFILFVNQFSMDSSNVEAVRDWPEHENRKALQRFLGFANFYQQFIRHYSSIASPLHHLTSSKVKFIWSPEGKEAFKQLKNKLTSTPYSPYRIQNISLLWRLMFQISEWVWCFLNVPRVTIRSICMPFF